MTHIHYFLLSLTQVLLLKNEVLGKSALLAYYIKRKFSGTQRCRACTGRADGTPLKTFKSALVKYKRFSLRGTSDYNEIFVYCFCDHLKISKRSLQPN
jgi:hypothetical protein